VWSRERARTLSLTCLTFLWPLLFFLYDGPQEEINAEITKSLPVGVNPQDLANHPVVFSLLSGCQILPSACGRICITVE
jgi:hypothetical protein